MIPVVDSSQIYLIWLFVRITPIRRGKGYKLVRCIPVSVFGGWQWQLHLSGYILIYVQGKHFNE